MPKQCATCGEFISESSWDPDDCGCGDKVCDFCSNNGHDVEIYHECQSLGTICINCENSGDHANFWEQ